MPTSPAGSRSSRAGWRAYHSEKKETRNGRCGITVEGRQELRQCDVWVVRQRDGSEGSWACFSRFQLLVSYILSLLWCSGDTPALCPTVPTICPQYFIIIFLLTSFIWRHSCKCLSIQVHMFFLISLKLRKCLPQC